MKQLNAYLSSIANNASPYEWEELNSGNELRFDTNTLPSPPPNLDRFFRAMETNCPINEYADSTYKELVQCIAAYENVDPSQIAITNSGDEAIDILAKACLEPGDSYIITPPTYEMFDVQCTLNRGVCIEVPLVQPSFTVNESELIEQSNNSNTKLMFLGSPNNPTGSDISNDVLKRILNKADCVVVVDEVYREFGKTSCVDLISRYPNLVVLRSFSKFAGLAGARIGYLISQPDMAKVFNAIKLPMGVSFLSSQLAQFVLTNDRDWIQTQARMIKKERTLMAKELTRFGFTVYPSQANFVLVDMGVNAARICNALKTRGIIVRSRSTKLYLTNCVRITIRSPKENIQLIKTLKEVI